MDEVAIQVDIDVKNPVMVTISEYAGTPRFSIRHYYEADDGELRPTKRGISIPADDTPALHSAIVAAYREATGKDLFEHVE